MQVYLLVSFVLTNLFFVWAAVKAGWYSVIGGITGFWLLALAPWCGPLLDRMFPSSAPVIAGPFFVLESQIDPCSGADDYNRWRPVVVGLVLDGAAHRRPGGIRIRAGVLNATMARWSCRRRRRSSAR